MKRITKKLSSIAISCLCIIASYTPVMADTVSFPVQYAECNLPEMREVKSHDFYIIRCNVADNRGASFAQKWNGYSWDYDYNYDGTLYGYRKGMQMYLYGYDDFVNNQKGSSLQLVVMVPEAGGYVRANTIVAQRSWDDEYKLIDYSKASKVTSVYDKAYILNHNNLTNYVSLFIENREMSMCTLDAAYIDTNIPIFRTYADLQNYIRDGDTSGIVPNFAQVTGGDSSSDTSSSTYIRSECKNEITAYIPKKIVLSESVNSFNTKVTGDLSSEMNVEITTTAQNIVFTDESGMKTVSVPITADKTLWTFQNVADEVSSVYDINATFDGFTAGKWSAQIPFTIKIINAKQE